MTPQQAATLTTDQHRDWCAEDDGWKEEYEDKWYNARKTGIGATRYDHPHPPTLDGAAKAMPEGWWWSRYETPAEGVKWHAGPRNGFASVCVYDTGDELRDRWLLVVLCRITAKEASK